MPKFLVAVKWEEYGEYIVEANSLAEAISKVEDDDVKYNLGNADGQYLDDSFQVDKSNSGELDDEGQFKRVPREFGE